MRNESFLLHMPSAPPLPTHRPANSTDKPQHWSELPRFTSPLPSTLLISFHYLLWHKTPQLCRQAKTSRAIHEEGNQFTMSCSKSLFQCCMRYWTAVWPMNSRGQTSTGPARPEELVLSILSYTRLLTEMLSEIGMHSPYPTDLGHIKTTKGLLTSISIRLVSDVFSPLTNSYKKITKHSVVSKKARSWAGKGLRYSGLHQTLQKCILYADIEHCLHILNTAPSLS